MYMLEQMRAVLMIVWFGRLLSDHRLDQTTAPSGQPAKVAPQVDAVMWDRSDRHCAYVALGEHKDDGAEHHMSHHVPIVGEEFQWQNR
jgi:hypothetical protein